jgi:Zn-dependent protease with chaperone function
MMTTPTSIQGSCYDGVSAQPQAAQLSIHGLNVHLQYAAVTHQEAMAQVDFGQATQQGVRLVSFQNGAQFQAADGAALNAYLAHHQAGKSWVDRATNNWRWVSVCAAGVLAAIAALYVWGIPAGAALAAPYVPQSIKNSLGDNALKGLDTYAFKPSLVDEATQAQIQARWQGALALAYPQQNYPQHRVLFRKMGDVPNAMALPNGVIVLTDGLVALLKDKPDTITGVLAHELGHIDHHHSMRALIEFSSLGLISSAVLGDYTVWLNQLPLLIGQMSYSRGHESEADDAAIRIMKASNINPAELALFFERAEKTAADKDKPTDHAKEADASAKGKNWSVPDLLRSHPSSAERMAKLRSAAK